MEKPKDKKLWMVEYPRLFDTVMLIVKFFKKVRLWLRGEKGNFVVL